MRNDLSEEMKPISTWLNKPMLIIGGLWDPHLKGAIDLYTRSLKVGGNPEIIIGNATHLDWWGGSQKDLLVFFDKHLKLKKNNHNKGPKVKKIWNISTEKWDDINKGNGTSYFFGLKNTIVSYGVFLYL